MTFIPIASPSFVIASAAKQSGRLQSAVGAPRYRARYLMI